MSEFRFPTLERIWETLNVHLNIFIVFYDDFILVLMNTHFLILFLVFMERFYFKTKYGSWLVKERPAANQELFQKWTQISKVSIVRYENKKKDFVIILIPIFMIQFVYNFMSTHIYNECICQWLFSWWKWENNLWRNLWLCSQKIIWFHIDLVDVRASFGTPSLRRLIRFVMNASTILWWYGHQRHFYSTNRSRKGNLTKKANEIKKGQNEREREREREKERERERGRESGMETVIDLLPSPGSCHYFQLTPTFSGDFLLFIFRGFVFFRFSFSFGRCPAPTAPVYFAAAGRLSHAAEKNRVPVSKIGSTKTKTKRHRWNPRPVPEPCAALPCSSRLDVVPVPIDFLASL